MYKNQMFTEDQSYMNLLATVTVKFSTQQPSTIMMVIGTMINYYYNGIKFKNLNNLALF